MPSLDSGGTCLVLSQPMTLKDFVRHSVFGTHLIEDGKIQGSLALLQQVREDWQAHGRSSTSRHRLETGPLNEGNRHSHASDLSRTRGAH